MNIVRRHINEKFSQESDPIKDLGIGALYKKQNFRSQDEMWNFLYEIIPIVLNIKDIKELLPNKYEYGLNNNYAWKYSEYIDKYILLNGELPPMRFQGFKEYIIKRLKKEGKLKECINEKFTQNSDPISNLNIGIKAKLLNWLKEYSENKPDRICVGTDISNFEWGALNGYNALLCFCAEENKFEFVKYLIEAKLISNIEYSDNLAIRWAAARGNVHMIKFLIENGADPNKPYNHNSLHCAIDYQHINAAKYLMKIVNEITIYQIRNAGFDKNLQEELKKLKEEKNGKSK